MKKLIITFLLVLWPCLGWGATYYIDQTSDLEGISPAPGDYILFKRGETFRTNLQTVSSGTADDFITYGAYGVGDKPKILGSVKQGDVCDWTEETPGFWYNDKMLTPGVGNVIAGGDKVIGPRVRDKVDLDTHGEWWYDYVSGKVFIYSTQGNPATLYGGDLELAKGDQGSGHIFLVGGESYIVIQNLDIRYGGVHGIRIEGPSTHVIVENCSVSFIGGGYLWGTQHTTAIRYGNCISMEYIRPNEALRHIYVRNCTISQAYDAGISMESTSPGAVQDNIFVYNNRLFLSEDNIEHASTATDATANNIYIHNNALSRAGFGWSNNQRPDSRAANIKLWPNKGSTSRFVITDNIMYESDLNCLYIHPEWTDIDNLYLDSNQYYQGSGYLIDFMGTSYTTQQFSAYQSAKQKDLNSKADIVVMGELP